MKTVILLMYRLLIGLFFLLPLCAFARPMVGLAFVDNLIGPNLEWSWSANSVYVVPAVHFSQGNGGAQDSWRWVAGYRHRLDSGNHSTSMDDSGFFIGLITGDLGGTVNYRRIGTGGELGYQLVKKYTRWTVSGSLVELNHDKKRNLREEPAVFFGVSVSLLK